jgi:hypothetical protein
MEEQENTKDSSAKTPIINETTPPPEAVAPIIETSSETTNIIVETDNTGEEVTSESTLSLENTDPEPVPQSDDTQASEEISVLSKPPDESSDKHDERIKHDGQINPSAPSTLPEAATTVGVAASQMGKHPHRNNKRFAVGMTIIVAIVLVAIAVFVFLNTGSNTKESTYNSTSSSQQSVDPAQLTEVVPAEVTDVDTLTSEIDATLLELDDESDFNDSDLSDRSLGL